MHRLLEEGLYVTTAARQIGRCRQTLYNWLKEEPKPKTPRRSKLDPYKPYIENRLRLFDLPATVMLQEIREQGYEGGITILRDFMARVKQHEVRRLVERFETEPGRQAQVDWASCGHIEHKGRRRRLSLLVVTLGYSRVIWARFVVRESRQVLLKLLERAFGELGGVPRELLFDNMKQVVDMVRSAEKATVINGEFQRFADHWGFESVVSPPYWPRAKGKVERAIQYIKRSFLEGRSFTDLDDLNAQLQLWLAEVANLRIHGTTKQRPIDRLAADQKAMRPLVAPPYPAVVRAQRRADHDAMISYRGVRYSIDPTVLGRRRGEPVEVQEGTDERLRIYHGGRLVGDHPIAPPGSPPQEDPRHAALRRELRQKPSGQRPCKTPRFEQRRDEAAQHDSITRFGSPPVVAHRPLTAYEKGGT